LFESYLVIEFTFQEFVDWFIVVKIFHEAHTMLYCRGLPQKFIASKAIFNCLAAVASKEGLLLHFLLFHISISFMVEHL